MEYTKLMAVLDDCCDKHMPMIIHWDNGCAFKSSGNLGSYETDNGLEPEEEGYVEYYGCWVRVAAVILPPCTSGADPACEQFRMGEGVEITDQNAPLKIEAEDGTLLWSRDRDFGPWVRPKPDGGE